MDDAAFDDNLMRDRWQNEDSDDEYATPYSSTLATTPSVTHVTSSSSAAVKKRADREIQNDIKTSKKKIDQLDKLFVQAHQKKASNRTISNIEQVMSTERRKLANLEDELLTEDEAVKQRADKLEQDIAQINDEIANLTIKAQLKTDELRMLRPYTAQDDTQNNTNLGQDEDDHERVWSRMEDRRKRYIEMYGVDPSVGSIAR